MSIELEATPRVTPPVPGQFSLRGLFIATLVSAMVFALLMPLVRRWPTDHQLHFLFVAVACVALPAALYLFQSWRQRRLERESGELLAYFPGNAAKVVTNFGVAMYLLGLGSWIWILNLTASHGREPPETWRFVVLGAFFNSGSLWAYGARGLHLRDRGIIFQSTRFDWHQVNRFTWPNDRNLLLYLASRTVFAIPIPAGARSVVERVLQAKASHNKNQPDPDSSTT